MKKKKVLKIILGVLLVLLGIAMGLPFWLEARIAPLLRTQVNQQINGQFDFEDARLSLIRSFPEARITLDGIRLTTNAPFEGDTLLLADQAYLVVGLSQLWKGGSEPFEISEFALDGADLRLKVDAQGRPNYDLAKPGEAQEESASESGPTLALRAYDIARSRLSYQSLEDGSTLLVLDSLALSGSGDLSLDVSELQTHTEGLISLELDSVAYLKRNRLSLDALLGIDLGTDTYTLKRNEGRINQMPLVFSGQVQLLEDGQDLDLAFQTPDGDFRNFLALIPEAYAGSLEGVETSGQFGLEGEIKGVLNDDQIPGFQIRMQARDGSFRYPDLPRSVEGIALQGTLANTSGQVEDTYMELPEARFSIDGEPFFLSGKAEALGGNPRVGAQLKGVLDLAKLRDVLPAEGLDVLSGRLKADIQTRFDLESVAQHRYAQTQTSGTLDLTGGRFVTEYLQDPLEIAQANLRFSPREVEVRELRAKVGQSDARLTGKLTQYLEYALGSGVLKGDLVMESGQLLVSDFTQQETEAAGQSDEASTFRIPPDLDLRIRAQAGRAEYDGLPLEDIRGELLVRDRQLLFREVRSRALDGMLALDGGLDTSGEVPGFALDLGIDGFRIREALESIELMQTLAPIAGILQGRLNSKISLQGNLLSDFSPDMMALAGKVTAEVLAAQPSGKKAAVLEALDTRLDFVNLEELDLKGLKTYLSFENGRVAVKPFSFTYRDIEVQVRGGHSFDQQLDYNVTLMVPARYLGPEVNRLMTALSEPGLENQPVPVGATVSGTYTQPQVQTDVKTVVSSLTTRLVEAQKQKALAGGKAKAQELIGGLFKKDSTKTDSLAKPSLGNVLKTVSGVARKDSTATDSTKTSGQVEQTARKILGGLLKRKKDTAATRKDSVPQAPD
ncbi:AsmA-like C-terminal region-containing protein [Robiginitalea sp. M366]|uniref:AsmA-like C-terminal region-containing protein n=1 Tax=Robiginitalea aestuariiviva TaxID=3036903 RepID=UPI00240D526C|nr:AsmA-like C-terminal region-containing protein [Robiginitalea aestuariiviva]MDG1570955.1 AsmA-like C-terminal region-containing protein [Robiginitalea aestuariiviva]